MEKEFGTGIIVPIKLTSGVYENVFTLEQSFFDQFGNQDIHGAQIEAAITLEKQESSMRLLVALKGSVVRLCDRCLGNVTMPVDYNAPIILKFSNTYMEEESDEIFFIDPTTTEIDLTQYIYDSVCVTLPLQSIHPAGQCDPDMEQKIAALRIN